MFGWKRRALEAERDRNCLRGIVRQFARGVDRWQAKARGRAATIRRLLDENLILQDGIRWRDEERKWAFLALGADDYPDGDLSMWIKARAADFTEMEQQAEKALAAQRCIARIDQAHLRYERRMEQEKKNWWYARLSKMASEERQRADKAEIERDAALEALATVGERFGEVARLLEELRSD